MNTESGQRRLIEAESKLSQALQRLHALRRAALYGNYDPAEFDKAVMAYRHAESEVQQAREDWARDHAAAAVPAPAAVAVAEREPEPFEPTPRLHFYKWLVETGRLSDWK